GIPVRSMFYKNTNKAIAKRASGIAVGSRHLLMMCGSMGCGPMARLAGRISRRLEDSMELSIVCGTNRGLYGKLKRRFKNNSRVHVLGYVEDISLLMDSADLYLTKPGGISVSEAALKGLPMVFVDAVAGCELHNMDFFISRGAARTASPPFKLAALCTELLGDEAALEAMSQSLLHFKGLRAAEAVCGRVEADCYENQTARGAV
ncbi:MAG: glycosyltransferase, partial [Oscillospiraceae bacterium]|nr:glycosyltransferase [Oscillospiraceae bacterium]